MSYLTITSHEQQECLSKSVTTKIKDTIEEMYNHTDSITAARWILEFIQNARDSSYESTPVTISITCRKEENHHILKLSHNGRPFRVKEILSLIYQVSSKQRFVLRKENDTAGKFGTGSLVLYLLSKQVQLDTAVSETGETPRKVSLHLDRSGATLEDIKTANTIATDRILQLDEAEVAADYTPGDISTIFTYILDDFGYQNYLSGIELLKKCVSYILAFDARIRQIELKSEDTAQSFSNMCTEHIIYSYRDRKLLSADPKLERITLCKAEQEAFTEDIIYTFSGEKCQLAFPVCVQDDQVICLEIPPELSRLFVRYPLLGTEKYPFPVILNCESFHTTEPRDGIYLINENAHDVKQNREYLQDARQLYLDLLQFAIRNHYRQIFHLICFPDNENTYDWIPKNWMDSYLLETRNELYKLPIIPDRSGQPNTYLDGHYVFPSCEALYNLLSSCNQLDFTLTKKEENESWAKAFPEGMVDTEWLIKELERKGSLNELQNLLTPDVHADDWLCQCFHLLAAEEDLLERCRNENQIIPNRLGLFCIGKNLWVAENIPDDFLSFVDQHGYSYAGQTVHPKFESFYTVWNRYSIRNILSTVTQKRMNDSDKQKLIYGILQFPETDPDLQDRQKQMAYLCRERGIVTSHPCADIASQTAPISIDKWTRRQLEETAIELLKTELNHCLYMEQSANGGIFPDAQGIAWYQHYLDFLEQYDHSQLLFTRKRYGMFPSQNGKLYQFQSQRIDDNLPEELKKIHNQLLLSYDSPIECSLLPKGLHSSCAEKLTETDLLHLIENKVLRCLSEKNKTEGKRLLFHWIMEHPDKAKKEMPDIYNQRYALCDNDTLDEEVQTGRRLQSLLRQFQIKDNQELEFILQHYHSQENESNTYTSLDDAFLREIGEWGEQFVYDYLSEQYTDTSLTLRRMDTKTYKNSGYDIALFDGDAPIHFWEVKSTTDTDIHILLQNISASQWKMAGNEDAHFTFAFVTNARSKRAKVEFYNIHLEKM